MNTRSISAFSTSNTFVFHDFILRGAVILAVFQGFILRGTAGSSITQEYFTRMLEYFGVKYSRFSSTSQVIWMFVLRVLVVSIWAIIIAHTPITRNTVILLGKILEAPENTLEHLWKLDPIKCQAPCWYSVHQ